MQARLCRYLLLDPNNVHDPLLLTWYNFNPRKDKFLYVQYEMKLLIQVSSFTPHFIMAAITYPCWD